MSFPHEVAPTELPKLKYFPGNQMKLYTNEALHFPSQD